MQPKRLSPKLKIYSTKQKPKGRRNRSSPMQLVALRLNDLARLFRARYGHVLPDDDAGQDDLLVAAHHLACLPRPRPAIMHWLEIWAPWMPVADASKLAGEVIANPKRWKADALAWELGLNADDRQALGITTIGAIDENRAARKKRRRKLARQRMAQHRKRNGAKSRKMYEDQSLEQQMPWIAEGISRATWYRRRSRETA